MSSGVPGQAVLIPGKAIQAKRDAGMFDPRQIDRALKNLERSGRQTTELGELLTTYGQTLKTKTWATAGDFGRTLFESYKYSGNTEMLPTRREGDSVVYTVQLTVPASQAIPDIDRVEKDYREARTRLVDYLVRIGQGETQKLVAEVKVIEATPQKWNRVSFYSGIISACTLCAEMLVAPGGLKANSPIVIAGYVVAGITFAGTFVAGKLSIPRYAAGRLREQLEDLSTEAGKKAGWTPAK